MMVGVASGTYSSIFIASPVLTEWKEREPAYRSRRARIKEAMGFVPTFPEDNVVARIDEVERHTAAAPVGDGSGGAVAPEPTPPETGARDRAGRGRRPAGGARGAARADPRGTGERGRRAPAGRSAERRAPAAEAARRSSRAAAAKAREEPLMAALVWFTTGVALWHFTVFLPDRFWGGIVGGLLGAVVGAMLTGAIAQIAIGDPLGETGIETVIFALPGTLLGLATIYFIGARQEAERLALEA